MMQDFETIIEFKNGWLKKRLGVRFDMLCFFRMLEEFGIELGDDVSELNKIPFDERLAVAVYTGAESYCVRHKQKVWFTKDQVLKWIDDSKITRGHFKTLGALWQEFIKDFEDRTEKKKAKGKR